MKNAFNLLLTVSCVLALSCSKDDDPDPPSGDVDLVKTQVIVFVQSGTPDLTVNYYYDDQRRLTRSLFSSGDSITLEYLSSQIIERSYRGSFLDSEVTYFLGTTGLVDSSARSAGQLTTGVRYNGAGYRVELREYDGSNALVSRHVHQYTGGNEVASYSYDGNGNLDYSQTNTYDTGHQNSLSHAAQGQPYLGKSSANVNTQVVRTDHISSQSETYLYEYDYDSGGRIATVRTFIDVTLAATQHFSYY